MRKHGALLPSVDFIIALVLLALFFYFVLHFVEMKRDAQAEQIRLTALRAESSSALLTFLSLPSEDSTMGLQMTRSLLQKEKALTKERAVILKGFFDPFLDTEKQSWRFVVYGPYIPGSFESSQFVSNDQHTEVESLIQEVVFGSHGMRLCEINRETMSEVILPITTSSDQIFSLKLDRCFP